jgi:Zn finger protein HypA/HybF involved in hydrogenase expression
MSGRVYRWCNGCSRRIDSTLFKDSRCPGCHSEAERAVARRVELTEEQEEALGSGAAYDYE